MGTEQEERIPELETVLADLMNKGYTPNDLEYAFEVSLTAVATDWVKWGDGHWRMDTVCPICGDGYAGVCGHAGMYEGEPVLRRQFKPDPNIDPSIVVCHDCKRHVHINETSKRWIFYLCPECAAKQTEVTS